MIEPGGDRSLLALVVTVIALLPAACGPSKSDKLAAFREKCAATEFTPAQCALLLDLYAATIDARLAAEDAALIGSAGVAIGTAGASAKR
jgi:hypothetical protein